MIAEILMATMPSLVMRLTDEFFTKRRDSVDVCELQEQVARLVVENNTQACELAEVRHAVLVLARYLVLTRQDAFMLEADQLTLTDQFLLDRETKVPPVIVDFGARVEQRIQQRQDHDIEVFRRRQSAGSVEQEMVPSPVLKHSETVVADNFLAGFTEEVLDMRLGRGRRQS
jgi:argonaute-like protein implicated in RNA metabolism and viral defense